MFESSRHSTRKMAGTNGPGFIAICSKMSPRHVEDQASSRAVGGSPTMRVATIVALVTIAGTRVAAQTDVGAQMALWSRALGVECTHCHVEGSWRDASRPTFDFARRMARMVDGLNAGPLRDVGQITCWTCHRGRAVPARLPRAAWEKILADYQPEFQGANEKHGIGDERAFRIAWCRLLTLS